jgi:hypothetical protein
VGTVVFTVSVTVCAPAPVMVTELGDRLHVGGSVGSERAVVTEQLRFTVPVNPFAGVTVIVIVFPVIAPGSMLTDEVPELIVNGGAVTIRAIVVDTVSPPETPVIVTVTGPPTMAEFAAVSVNTLEPEVGFVAKLAVTPLGSPPAERVTLPENPFAGFTVMVSVLLLPWATESIAAEGESVKLDAGFTVSATVVVAVTEPEVPVIVTVTGPPAVAAPVAVSVSRLDPIAGFVPNDAVTPLGKSLAERVTLPENPFAGFTVMVSVLLLP